MNIIRISGVAESSCPNRLFHHARGNKTRIEQYFAHYFSPWNILLPAQDVKESRRGKIHSQGWTIQYLFGEDERGLYLDFFATHRMTNDRHVRVYESGEVETLPSYREFIVTPADASEEEKRRIEQEYFAYNRQVSEELARKGFTG